MTRFDTIKKRFTNHVNRDNKRPYGVFGVERADMKSLIAVYEAALRLSEDRERTDLELLAALEPLQREVK